MKVSAKEEYGLRLMLQLARREREGNEHPLTLAEMARHEGLTVAHVAKLIRSLRKAGLVRSALGRSGGYHIARPAAGVSVAEVMAALGGRLYDTEYCAKFRGDLSSCTHSVDCSIRSLWGVLETLLDRVLGKTMLADLVCSTEQGMTAALGGGAPAASRGFERAR